MSARLPAVDKLRLTLEHAALRHAEPVEARRHARKRK